jgi:hypothetical protein
VSSPLRAREMNRYTLQSTLAAMVAATRSLVRYGGLICLALLGLACLPLSVQAAGFDSDYSINSSSPAKMRSI